ncbi:MAG: glycosyltransferase [Pseudomonadota bacterium]
MIQKIAFIDHHFHQFTKSSHFFQELLREKFEVDVFFAAVDIHNMVVEIADAGYDAVVCWQTEYLCPFFVRRGISTIGIPMWDGVCTLSDAYWHSLTGTKFICFSSDLYERITSCGHTALHVQYMKDPANFPQQTDFDELRVVFWQRLPEHGLNGQFVRNVIQDAGSIHIHNAPDCSDPSEHPINFGSVSFFDPTRNHYAKALDRSNVLICPRFTEGIGMAMIEGLTRGMCVIANDEGTHTDYITNWVDGVFVDYRKAIMGSVDLPLSPELARELGENARVRAFEAYDAWKQSESNIQTFVADQKTSCEAEQLRTMSDYEIALFVSRAAVNVHEYIANFQQLES